MAQKVNPKAFRLDVPHRGHSSLVFRKQSFNGVVGNKRKKKGIQINPSHSVDFMGWENTVSGISYSKMMLGAYLGFLRLVEENSMETRIRFGGLRNRRTTVRVPGSGNAERQITVEWIPSNGLDRSGEQRKRRNQVFKQLEWKAEEIWMHHGLYQDSSLGQVRIRFLLLNLLGILDDVKPLNDEVRSLLEKSNRTKEEERRQKKAETSGSNHLMLGGRRGKPGNEEAIPSSVVVKVMRLAGVHPVSPLLSRILVNWIESNDSQGKAIQEFYQMRLRTSSSLEFGLVRPVFEGSTESMKEREPKQKYGLTSKGGYRGCRILVKGRVDGARRTQQDVYQIGVLPWSTRSAPMSTCRIVARTKHGTMGVEITYAY